MRVVSRVIVIVISKRGEKWQTGMEEYYSLRISSKVSQPMALTLHGSTPSFAFIRCTAQFAYRAADHSTGTRTS